MVRWSKEPRRISVVEGRAAANLARAFKVVCCFTYNNETTGSYACQAPNEHGRVKFQSSTRKLAEGLAPAKRRGKVFVGLDLCSRDAWAFARGVRADITIELPLGRSDPETFRSRGAWKGLCSRATNSNPGQIASTCKPDATGTCKPKQPNGLCVSRQKLAMN